MGTPLRPRFFWCCVFLVLLSVCFCCVCLWLHDHLPINCLTASVTSVFCCSSCLLRVPRYSVALDTIIINADVGTSVSTCQQQSLYEVCTLYELCSVSESTVSELSHADHGDVLLRHALPGTDKVLPAQAGSTTLAATAVNTAVASPMASSSQQTEPLVKRQSNANARAAPRHSAGTPAGMMSLGSPR